MYNFTIIIDVIEIIKDKTVKGFNSLSPFPIIYKNINTHAKANDGIFSKTISIRSFLSVKVNILPIYLQ